ncbi:hypothetical protein SK128_012435 [Halocaridina rubra]|uniref:Uncharacterized protein n=1 Tax=Halocaridina rubra TaxID=373956 RepID=A0AAN8WAD4_HALRR
MRLVRRGCFRNLYHIGLIILVIYLLRREMEWVSERYGAKDDDISVLNHEEQNLQNDIPKDVDNEVKGEDPDNGAGDGDIPGGIDINDVGAGNGEIPDSDNNGGAGKVVIPDENNLGAEGEGDVPNGKNGDADDGEISINSNGDKGNGDNHPNPSEDDHLDHFSLRNMPFHVDDLIKEVKLHNYDNHDPKKDVNVKAPREEAGNIGMEEGLAAVNDEENANLFYNANDPQKPVDVVDRVVNDIVKVVNEGLNEQLKVADQDLNNHNLNGDDNSVKDNRKVVNEGLNEQLKAVDQDLNNHNLNGDENSVKDNIKIVDDDAHIENKDDKLQNLDVVRRPDDNGQDIVQPAGNNALNVVPEEKDKPFRFDEINAKLYKDKNIDSFIFDPESGWIPFIAEEDKNKDKKKNSAEVRKQQNGAKPEYTDKRDPVQRGDKEDNDRRSGDGASLRLLYTNADGLAALPLMDIENAMGRLYEDLILARAGDEVGVMEGRRRSHLYTTGTHMVFLEVGVKLTPSWLPPLLGKN